VIITADPIIIVGALARVSLSTLYFDELPRCVSMIHFAFPLIPRDWQIGEAD
jgi:TRAP-type mannitol/chloroaromatic compound transport system permease small subunit